jgi:hypothetical protein
MNPIRRPIQRSASCGWLAACLIYFAAPLCEACDYCLLGQGISPLQTQKGAGLRIAQRYTLLDSVYSGTDDVSNPGVKERYWATDVAGFYSVNDRLLVLVNAPIRKTDGDGELTDGPNGVPEREDSTGGASGLGDVSVLARYRLFGRHTIDSSTLVAGVLGVKLPTGSTDQHNDQGEYLDSHLQLGTGSTDALFGVSVDHAIDRFSMSCNVLIALTGDGETGHQSHQFGNSVNWDVTTKYRISPAVTGESDDAWFVSFGLNGDLRDHEHLGGDRVADSGGHTVYVTPGVQFVLEEKWVFEATYQYAVYHDLNETQLGEDYRIFGSATYLF